jgi:hypothetical protein
MDFNNTIGGAIMITERRLVLCAALVALGSALLVVGAELPRDSAPRLSPTAPPAGAWGEPAGGLQVAAWPVTATAQRGGPVLVGVSVKNVSERTINLDLWLKSCEILFEDEPVPLTRFGRALAGLDPKHTFAGSHQHVFLKPGESRMSLVRLDLGWDLSLEGRYGFNIKYTWRNVEPYKVYEAVAPAVPFEVADKGQADIEDVYRLRFGPEALARGAAIQRVRELATDAIRALGEVVQLGPHDDDMLMAREAIESLGRQAQTFLKVPGGTAPKGVP